MTSQRPFGSKSTEDKLKIVEGYLRQYLVALKDQPFRKIYFDAFAGTGVGRVETMADKGQPAFDVMPDLEILAGSAFRALGLDLAFDEYILVEKSQKKAAELKAEIRDRFPDRLSRVTVVADDVNVVVRPFCERFRKEALRAVMFLDPFGNQVSWEAIQSVAVTRKIDTWYLFPAGHGVFRQISNKGVPNPDSIASINRMLGTDEWRTRFVTAEVAEDLFGEPSILGIKKATTGQITEYVLNRLRGPFGEEGVLDSWVPLGRDRRHDYSLIFACANPRGREIAKRIANGVMKAAGMRRGRLE